MGSGNIEKLWDKKVIENIEKITWPKMMRTASIWNYYLYSGFVKLGIKINRSMKDWDIPDKVRGVMPIDIFWKTMPPQRIWYDFQDFPRQYYEKTVKGNDVYFKIMLHKDSTHYDRIYPIGQTAATAQVSLFEKLPKRKKDIDVIGMFRNTDQGIRKAAVAIVKGQRWRSFVGMAQFRNRQPLPKNIQQRKVGYAEHLILQNRSKICLDFPGVGGEWSWRWTEILGMGGFCLRIAPHHACPGNPRNCWAEVKRNLSDLVEKIDYYLANDEARNEIAKNGKEYYETYLSPAAQARYVLNIAMERRDD